MYKLRLGSTLDLLFKDKSLLIFTETLMTLGGSFSKPPISLFDYQKVAIRVRDQFLQDAGADLAVLGLAHGTIDYVLLNFLAIKRNDDSMKDSLWKVVILSKKLLSLL